MIRNLWCIFIAGAWTSLMFPFAVLSMLVKWNASASMYVVQRLWSPVLLWAGGAKLEVSGLENIDASKPAIYVSNHQSTIDIPALFMALPVDLRFVAKKSLQYVPLMGWYMSLANFVFVDRGNRREAIASLDAAGKRIRGGVSIISFAEGTRSDNNEVLPFKKGPFSLALKAGVPIVPVSIEGSGKLMPKNSWRITPGPIRVKVGAPIDVAKYGENREALIKDVRAAVIALNLELGGKGGNIADAIAAPGKEGIGRSAAEQSEDAA